MELFSYFLKSNLTYWDFDFTIIMMKHFNRKLYLFLSIILILFLISFLVFRTVKFRTTKKIPSDSNQLILGFSQIGSESAWRTKNTQSIFEAAAQNNIQIIFDDAQQKQANQLKAIRSFIVYQVDVIAFVPIVEDGWDNVLQEAKDANIPVIIVDREINCDPSLYAGFLGEDGFSEGLKAAQFLFDKCKDNEESKINIVEFSGTMNSSVAMKRSEGFKSIIKNDNKFSIIYSEDGDFLRSRGKEIMDKILLNSEGQLKINDEQIHVIYSHNDSMTLGILDSMKSYKINPEDVIIISIDAEQKSIDALVEGKLNCVIECNPNLGEPLMKLIKDVSSGKTIPRETYSEEKTFTENDDFSTYTPRGY